MKSSVVEQNQVYPEYIGQRGSGISMLNCRGCNFWHAMWGVHVHVHRCHLLGSPDGGAWKLFGNLNLGSTSTSGGPCQRPKPAVPDPTREYWPFHARVIERKFYLQSD